MAFGSLRGTLTGNSTSPGTGISATGSVAVTKGDLIVASYALRNAANNVSITDNLGNSYIQLPSLDSIGNSPSRPFWLIVPANGTLTSATATHASTTGDAAFAVSVYEGIFDGWALDRYTAQAADGTNPYTCPNSGTLSQADELIVGIQSQGNGNAAASYGATSPYSVGGTAASGTGANTSSTAIIHHVVASTTGEAPEVTSAASTNGGVQTASFRKQRPSPVTGDCIGLLGDGIRGVTGNGILNGLATVAIGDIVVVVWGGLDATATDFSAASDNLGNTYTMVTGFSDASANVCRAAYSIVTTAGDLTTITATRAGTGICSFLAAVFKGPATALDVTVACASIASATPLSWGATGTLAQADELIIAYNGDHAARLYTPVSPSVLSGQAFLGNSPGGGTTANIFSQLVSSTSSVTMQSNQDSASATVGGVLTFKVTVTAAPQPFNQEDWPLTPAPVPANNLKNWRYSYNPNLIGKDAFPPGEIRLELPTKPYEYPAQLRQWFSKLPPPIPVPPVGEAVVDRPQLAAQGPLPILTASVNLALNAPSPPPLVVLLGQAVM